MDSDKPIVYCDKGILERIEEEAQHKTINNPISEEDFYRLIVDIFNEIVEPQPLIIIISNGLTEEQIERIKNYYSNL